MDVASRKLLARRGRFRGLARIAVLICFHALRGRGGLDDLAVVVDPELERYGLALWSGAGDGEMAQFCLLAPSEFHLFAALEHNGRGHLSLSENVNLKLLGR